MSTAPRFEIDLGAFWHAPYPTPARLRAIVADVALPAIFEKLDGMVRDTTDPVRIGGWAFRGLLNLPVHWH